MSLLLRRRLPLLFLGLLAAGCSQSGPPAGWAPGQGVRIGQSAPDIQGTDADGQAFRLSDYRGKVVMLDFWGNW